MQTNKFDPSILQKPDLRGRCGKVCFDKRTAETKRNTLEREGREKMRIYNCEDCSAWHLSKINKYKK